MNGALCNALKIHRGVFYSRIRLHARALGGLLLDVSVYAGLDGRRLFSCLLEQSDLDVSTPVAIPFSIYFASTRIPL